MIKHIRDALRHVFHENGCVLGCLLLCLAFPIVVLWHIMTWNTESNADDGV